MDIISKLLLWATYAMIISFFISCARTFQVGPLGPANQMTQTPTNVPSSTPTMTLTVVQTATMTITPTYTFTMTPTPTSIPVPTCGTTTSPGCAAMTIVDFHGNLSSTQRADQPGGVLQVILPSGEPVLPFAIGGGLPLNGAIAQYYPWNGGMVVQETSDYDFFHSVVTGSGCGQHLMPIMMGAAWLETSNSAGITTFAWNQNPVVPPACSAVKTSTDSLGNPRQINFNFYQVNDLGTASPPINAGLTITHVLYAWYAFETTGGQQPSDSNLLGGTAINEGFQSNPCVDGSGGVGRGNSPSGWYWGDFLFFNSDGSIASEGSIDQMNGTQTKAMLYIDPNGLGQLQVELNFGSAGMIGYGQRDGITGDAGSSNVY
jgi:hypothetical protein